MKPPSELTPPELLSLNRNPLGILGWPEDQRAELLELIEDEVQAWERQRTPAQIDWLRSPVPDPVSVARSLVAPRHQVS